MDVKKDIRLLLVLRRFDSQFPNVLGGVISSSEELIYQARSQNILFEYVSTNKSKYRFRWLSLPFILYEISQKAFKSDHIALNLNEIEIPYIGTYTVLLARILRKTVSLRVFAGNIDSVMASRNFVERLAFSFVISNVDLRFFETKRLLKIYEDKAPTHQFPTSRSQTLYRGTRPFKGKFIYFGGVKKDKGVLMAKNAIGRLVDEGYSIDFWGALFDGLKPKDLDSHNSKYRGMIADGEVGKVLSGYDVLLLPSVWAGEGYPGVIVEAFAAGLPVIATDLPSFREMISDGENGFLVRPNDLEHLVELIAKIRSLDYQKLSINASKEYQNYCPVMLHKEYFEKINNLSKRHEEN